MKRFSYITTVLALLLLFNTVSAGELSNDLNKLIQGKSDNEPVKVWIQLYRTENQGQLKKKLVQNYKKRSDRHSEGISHFKSKHAESQKNLIDHLKTLNTNKQTKPNLKAHWLVNVIETELTVGQIKSLVNRNDIDRIYSIPRLETIEPTDEKTAPLKSTAGIEDNLNYINAPAAWAAGFTGSGSLICSFDTGVDGLHPALFNNWKGHDGDSAAAWFDPKTNEPFPHTISNCGFATCKTSHGTHTMGIMVGHDDASGDIIGVAPEAKWISAAIIDISGISIIDAFEWAADPDGNPNTIDDVPDVINHSWGVDDVDCQNIFYNLIDNTEALGIINIFSAGNDGSFAESIRNPADRALDSLDCFAVGNLKHSEMILATNSSRGPSKCIQGNIKPNVVAPGYQIRSSYPNGAYSILSGTSMASPHVAGLVALLRQKNPNATVDEIKTAILNSAKSIGQDTPNNDIGWGAIDCMAALNYLSGNNATPNVRVYAFDHDPISPGDIVEGSLILKNLGANVSSVFVSLVNSNSALTILNGTGSFGTIAEGDTVRTASTIRVQVSDTVTVGSILSLDMNITGVGYSKTVKLFFMIEPELFRSFLTHNVGNTNFSLTNFGTFGLGDDSFFPAGGVGFTFGLRPNDLFESGLMIGRNAFKISDGVRNGAGEPDGDFGVIPGGNIQFVTPKAGVTQQSSARFSDLRAESPNNIEIKQNAYSFNYSPYQDFIILQFIIKNIGSSSLNDLYVGLYMDWDIPFFNTNVGGYELAEDFGWIAYRSGSTNMHYRGVKVIDGTTATAYTALGELTYYSGDGFTEAEKFTALSNGFGTANTFRDSTVDLMQVVAAKTTLFAGEIDTISFAVMAGETFTEIKTAAVSAMDAYSGVVTDVGTDVDDDNNTGELPVSFRLFQNYPNPFNPATTISFELPHSSEYTLSIYNLVGQKVDEFMGYSKAGMVTINWSADNFASGIYLYKLTTEDFSASKKMLLLK